LADIKLSKINIEGFDGNKCSKIKWKIGMISGNMYENGLPHTRDDVIIIPKSIMSIFNYNIINNDYDK
jgi:hypothetical protein